MGLTYTEIDLINAGDQTNVVRGYINEKQVRKTTVRAMVDTGTGSLVISEAVCQTLGLAIKGLRPSYLADGSKQVYKVTEPVLIQWQGRNTVCNAVVIPDIEEVLLGAIPLEDMDLVVNPVKQTLEGAHGDEVIYMLK
ncbi:hypothetical protein AGMMS49928_23910 [Spirochaetia bacterium]|nr:hypothetical protein AGMMS49928_23910 [Spirochaetia bacterium]